MSPTARLAGAPSTSRPGGEEATGHPDGVQATALIRAAYNGRVTTLPQLRSDGPFHLRHMRGSGRFATVGIIGAMSAPLGGDRLTIDITAEDRAELKVTTGAATLALRGPTTEPATYDVKITAGEGARVHWLPHPLISAAGSNLRQTCTIELASTARLVLREEQLLGRADEEPGHLVTRLRVRRGGRLILDQQSAYGPPEPAWNGPAVLGDHRAVGQLLMVAPEPSAVRAPVLLGEEPRGARGILTPLADGHALLATVAAPGSAALRQLLDEAFALASRG
ncbi:urease accessory protein UreD [Streptomyces sp. NBC_00046]|uniref:urease accessory protein UreD n=1 Tax=Streptomyces sp. NBC_00046 TaxID=2975626 RepID=UPI002F916A86